MNASLTDDLLNQLQGQPLNQMGPQLGLSESQPAAAVSTALPLPRRALGRHANPAGGGIRDA